MPVSISSQILKIYSKKYVHFENMTIVVKFHHFWKFMLLTSHCGTVPEYVDQACHLNMLKEQVSGFPTKLKSSKTDFLPARATTAKLTHQKSRFVLRQHRLTTTEYGWLAPLCAVAQAGWRSYLTAPRPRPKLSASGHTRPRPETLPETGTYNNQQQGRERSMLNFCQPTMWPLRTRTKSSEIKRPNAIVA